MSVSPQNQCFCKAKSCTQHIFCFTVINWFADQFFLFKNFTMFLFSETISATISVGNELWHLQTCNNNYNKNIHDWDLCVDSIKHNWQDFITKMPMLYILSYEILLTRQQVFGKQTLLVTFVVHFFLKTRTHNICFHISHENCCKSKEIYFDQMCWVISLPQKAESESQSICAMMPPRNPLIIVFETQKYLFQNTYMTDSKTPGLTHQKGQRSPVGFPL